MRRNTKRHPKGQGRRPRGQRHTRERRRPHLKDPKDLLSSYEDGNNDAHVEFAAAAAATDAAATAQNAAEDATVATFGAIKAITETIERIEAMKPTTTSAVVIAEASIKNDALLRGLRGLLMIAADNSHRP